MNCLGNLFEGENTCWIILIVILVLLLCCCGSGTSQGCGCTMYDCQPNRCCD